MAHNFLQNFVYTKNVNTKSQAWHKLFVKMSLTDFDILNSPRLISRKIWVAEILQESNSHVWCQQFRQTNAKKCHVICSTKVQRKLIGRNAVKRDQNDFPEHWKTFKNILDSPKAVKIRQKSVFECSRVTLICGQEGREVNVTPI